METTIFTPRHASTDIRLKMQISLSDKEVFDANATNRTFVCVHDHVTGKNYEVRKASCGSSCACDAVYKDC